MFEIVRYQREDGSEPYTEWFRRLRDVMAKVNIGKRLRRVQVGNFGDCKPVGEGVSELRIDTGPGYRVYIGLRGSTMVILLCGGDKSSQNRDLERAKSFWADWKRRQT
ncbi:MAG TPA: type II toxin-antitoxin system RelE/ParE family toxin [Terracidiphilus sp.]